MQVRVLFFASVAEAAGTREWLLDLSEHARIRDAWSRVESRLPELGELLRSTRAARNGRLASLDDELVDGDELAILPPVGGG